MWTCLIGPSGARTSAVPSWRGLCAVPRPLQWTNLLKWVQLNLNYFEPWHVCGTPNKRLCTFLLKNRTVVQCTCTYIMYTTHVCVNATTHVQVHTVHHTCTHGFLADFTTSFSQIDKWCHFGQFSCMCSPWWVSDHGITLDKNRHDLILYMWFMHCKTRVHIHVYTVHGHTVCI